MDTVLVTGGCGIIGQRICSGLLKKGYAVVATDIDEQHYNTGKMNYTYVQCGPADKNKFAEIFENYDIKILIHAACTADNDIGPMITERELNESKQCDKFLYRYAMTENVEKIVLISTDQVYDFPKTREPIRENAEIKTVSNYSIMKYASEKALIAELQHHKEVLCCITRIAPVYTFEYTENLMAKITDPKDGSKFVLGQGQNGYQFCCVHNLVDFILCFVKTADDHKYAGIYNVSDKDIITAAEIINFMRTNYNLGTVLQKTPGGTMSKIKNLFGVSKEERTNYRYLDMNKLDNNNILDNTKAAKICSPRWDLSNTK